MRVELGRYRLGETLGVGGMGAVLSANRKADDAPFAIKLLSDLRASQMAAREEFAHEIWSLARLDHPGIVSVVDYGVVDQQEASAHPTLTEGTPYLVMERAAGHLSHSRFPRQWHELVPIIMQVLDALAHAHARNVVHRDLKPGNVLCAPREGLPDRWKLADFGIAHALDRHAADGAWGKSVGTPSYMAPEQIAGEWRDFGPWTDLYAVGVLVYELVSGLTPFPTLTGKALMNAVVERPIPSPVARFPLPPDFEEWLGRLMARNFLDRAQRAADVALWLVQLGPPRSTDSALPMADRPSSLNGTTHTLPFEALNGNMLSMRLLPEGPANDRLPRMSIPPSWTSLEPARDRPEWMQGALPRIPPFQGRETERDRLWRALIEVDKGGGAQAVVIRGPSGSGRTALARWLVERAHELGAAWQLVCTHSTPPRDLDGVGPMFSTFLRSVDLPRSMLLERMRTLLQLREGGSGLEFVVAELIAPSAEDEETPVRFGSMLERNAAALGALQVLTDVLGTADDNAPRRSVVALIDEAHLGEEALGLVHLAVANRAGLPTPILFLLTAPEGKDGGSVLQAIEALEGAQTLHLDPLPETLLKELEGQVIPGVAALRTEMGPPIDGEGAALASKIRSTITSTATTSDDL